MIILDYPPEYMMGTMGVEKALGWVKRLLKRRSKIRRKCMLELARLCGTMCVWHKKHFSILEYRVYGMLDRTGLFK